MRRHKNCEADRARHRMYYNAADVNGKLIINLRDLSHTMRFLYEGKGSQKRILIVLLETGEITQRALTERLGIQPGSASEVIAKLEHAGLIMRTSSAEDRRTAVVSLTEEGKRQALEAGEQRNRRHEEMFSCLSEQEKMQLLTLLEKINQEWEKRYQDAVREEKPMRCHQALHTQYGRTRKSEQGES